MSKNATSGEMQELRQLLEFMTERQHVWRRRFVEDQKPPWTDDPILQEYHLCNVYRELDYGTQFLQDEILGQEDDREVLFNVLLYRFFNRPKTYLRIGGFQSPDEFQPEQTAHDLLVLDDPLFSSAYRVTTQKWAGADTKAENILLGILRDDVLANLDDYTDRILNADTMETAFDVLTEIRGVGDFLAYEIVTDLNYDLLPFHENDFVNIGPGAQSGITYVFQEKPDPGQIYWLTLNQGQLFDSFDLEFPYWEDKPLTARCFEHSMCEFSKYVDLKYNQVDRRLFEPRDYGQRRFDDYD